MLHDTAELLQGRPQLPERRWCIIVLCEFLDDGEAVNEGSHVGSQCDEYRSIAIQRHKLVTSVELLLQISKTILHLEYIRLAVDIGLSSQAGGDFDLMVGGQHLPASPIVQAA